MKKIFDFIYDIAVRIVLVAIGLSPFVMTYIESSSDDVLASMFVTFMLGGWLFFAIAILAICGIIHKVAEAFNYQIKWLEEGI